MEKECSKCRVIKPLIEYSPNRGSKGGYRNKCKLCMSLEQRLRPHAPYIPHPRTKYTDEEIRQHRRTSYKKWSTKHKAEISASKRKRYHNDPNFKILNNIRNRIYGVIQNIAKAGHSIELLGCSIQKYRQYLESLFTEGMTWDNYGNKVNQWSIDHIKPCSSFDMSKPENQKACFHYTNTRPLWHIDNLIKGDKIVDIR